MYILCNNLKTKKLDDVKYVWEQRDDPNYNVSDTNVIIANNSIISEYIASDIFES